MEQCKISIYLTSARRNIRWVIDHGKSGVNGDCTEILSQAYNMLREAELACLARRNELGSGCVLRDQSEETSK